MSKKVKCDYCNINTELVSGSVIYPHRKDLKHLNFWQCSECKAYVGCHKAGNGHGNGTRALGKPANKETRKARNSAHNAFDVIWKRKIKTRGKAYIWLAKEVGKALRQDFKGNIHIGVCTIELCDLIINLSNNLVRKENRER